MFRRGLILLVAALPWPMSLQAAGVSGAPPLPPPRPPDLAAPPPPEPGPVEGACAARLRTRGYEVARAPASASGDAECKIADPVKLQSIRTASGASIRVAGDPVMDCRLAEQFGEWVGRVASPLLSQATGANLQALRDVGGYECRRRNRQTSGKMSAHAQGLAVDVGAFELANGRMVRVDTADAALAPAMAALRQAACGWFLTVLGPGSDPAHATHLHLDLQQHGTSDRYRICQ